MTMAALAAGARRLTAAEWRVLGESAALAVAVEAALRLLPLARILHFVQERPLAGVPALDRAACERVARLARWPSRVLPLPATCLRVALVQVAVLRRRQVPATVRFGVQRGAGGALEFHAWADCDGPIDDRAGAADYRTFEPVAAAAISRSARWSRPAAPPDVAA
jgi:hypothetical protein